MQISLVTTMVMVFFRQLFTTSNSFDRRSNVFLLPMSCVRMAFRNCSTLICLLRLTYQNAASFSGWEWHYIAWYVYFTPGRGAKRCSQHVCLCDCSHFWKKNNWPDLYDMFCMCHLWQWLVLLLTTMQYVLYFGFVDDVMFWYNWAYGHNKGTADEPGARCRKYLKIYHTIMSEMCSP